jgi:hypothetical protein
MALSSPVALCESGMEGYAMHPPAHAQTAPLIGPFGRPIDQPSAYCPIPQRLITDLHDNVLAIGLYGFIARLYLVAQTPIPLSVPDVLRYDPALSRGAVLRALARLIAGGYLHEAAQPGLKTRYTPTWGRVGGAPLAWNMQQPCLGRPRHIARLRLDRRLFDICMGKLVPHATRAAVITRYITTPVVALNDIGCYALTLAGLPRSTPALIRLGAVYEDTARPLPDDQRLLALISQRALDLDEAMDANAGLTLSGTRKLGVQPFLGANAATSQPLFFVPPGMIGSLIHPMIGSLIGSDAANTCPASAAVSDEPRSDGSAKGITWESRDPREEANPPLPPSHCTANGGGAKAIVQKSVQRRRSQEIELLPDTEAAAALQAINVKPAQIIELAHMPLATVEAAITDGRGRRGIRDLAGWVVSLLRTHRDYGWKITPPAPAPDSPEDLRAAFARYAAEQGAEQHTVSADIEQRFDDSPPPEPADSSLNIVKLWNTVLATMRIQVSRPEFNTWLRHAILLSIENGIATISAPSTFVKDGLENRYAGALREVIRMLIGFPIQLRFVIHEQNVAARPVGEVQELAGPASDLLEESIPTIAAQQTPASGVNHRPDWISPMHWGRLPTLLRAALIGSTLSDGAVQAVSPHLTRLIEMRYAHEVTALIAAARNCDPPPLEGD